MANVIAQRRHQAPLLDENAFKLMKVFSVGPSTGTNIRRRSTEFADHFFECARSTCSMPKEFGAHEIEVHQTCLLRTVLEEANLVPILKGDPVHFARVPIKLVGHLLHEQRTGVSGVLDVTGKKNGFLCRSSVEGTNEIRLVTLWYEDGWFIEDTPWQYGHLLEGPMRFFFATKR